MGESDKGWTRGLKHHERLKGLASVMFEFMKFHV